MLMILPGLIYLAINNYLPMFGLIIAFKKLDYAKGILGSPWVGFDNFKFLFKTSDAYIITRNTLLYNGVFIIVTMLLSIAVAILLNEIQKKFMARLYQSIILSAVPDFYGHRGLPRVRFLWQRPGLYEQYDSPGAWAGADLVVHGAAILALHFNACASMEDDRLHVHHLLGRDYRHRSGILRS